MFEMNHFSPTSWLIPDKYSEICLVYLDISFVDLLQLMVYGVLPMCQALHIKQWIRQTVLLWGTYRLEE